MVTPDERAALRQDVLAVIATAFDDPAWTNGKTADAVLALTDKALDAETARADAVDVNPRGIVRRDIADAYAAAHQETP